MKEVNTLIIGGGISGLACANRLNEEGVDFLLVSKNLGGRLLDSKTHTVDYGAAYITKDYWNVSKYVKKREKFKLKDFYFVSEKGIKNFWQLIEIKNLLKMFFVGYHVLRLRSHLLRYRKKAPHKSVKECFESDPVLMYYWNTNAKVFIDKNNLQFLDDLIGNPVTATTAFTESKNVNLAYYLGMFFCAIIPTWIVDFKNTVELLTKGYQDKIKISSVNKVFERKDGKFIVSTSKEKYIAKHIVFAAPQKSLNKVYSLPKPNNQQQAYTFHVVGRRRDIYANKKSVLFRPHHHDVYMLWRQKCGADIVYSGIPNPNFKEYYEIYHIVKKIHWNPGMIIPRNELIDQNFRKNMWLASDYNLSLMEDCFLTGVYAANQIIKNSKGL